MFTEMKTFWSEDEGAVTVDWVVLSAAVIGLAAGVVAAVEEENLTQSTVDELSEGVPDTGF